ncbi:MAG: YetF domain-containing protein [Sporosarcina sp.]
MDFFYGQETLTSIQWILRAIMSFLFLLIATKMMGARSISQLRLIDFTIALILGNIIAHPLSDEKLGMKGSLITTTVLIILYIIFVFLSLKWNTFRKWFEPSPYPLIKNGEIVYANLAKARITIDHLLSELRKEKIEDVEKVALAQWEPDGTISFFLSPQLQALTPEDMQLIKKPFSFQSIIIKEGNIDFQELLHTGKDTLWLENKISILNVEISDILLATIDNSDNMKIYLYD